MSQLLSPESPQWKYSMSLQIRLPPWRNNGFWRKFNSLTILGCWQSMCQLSRCYWYRRKQHRFYNLLGFAMSLNKSQRWEFVWGLRLHKESAVHAEAEQSLSQKGLTGQPHHNNSSQQAGNLQHECQFHTCASMQEHMWGETRTLCVNPEWQLKEWPKDSGKFHQLCCSAFVLSSPLLPPHLAASYLFI